MIEGRDQKELRLSGNSHYVSISLKQECSLAFMIMNHISSDSIFSERNCSHCMEEYGTELDPIYCESPFPINIFLFEKTLEVPFNYISQVPFRKEKGHTFLQRV